MIKLEGVPEAQRKYESYFNGIRARIDANAREGMNEAVAGLRATVIARMHAAGIHDRSGGTVQAILTNNGKKAVYARKEDDQIVGIVTTVKADQQGNDPRMPMGAWLGAGTVHSAIANKLMVFVAPDGKLVFTRKIKAFRVPGRPFLTPARDEFEGTYIAIMKSKLSEAVQP
jgi:hypothetical protein